MRRVQLLLTTGFLLAVAGGAAAMDVKGTVTAVDAAKRTISVKVDDNVQAFDVAKDAKVYELYGSGKRTGYNETAGGLADVKLDAIVTLSTDFLDGREQATRIKIESASSRAPRKKTPSASPPADKPATTDVKGTITALDGRRLLMTVSVDGKTQKFTAAKDCKVFVQTNKPEKKKPRYDVAPNGLADITVGLDVTMTLDSSSGKDLVTMVKILSPPKK
jgi:hypothetical protein